MRRTCRQVKRDCRSSFLNRIAFCGAPIPGLITALTAGVGAKVAKGDKLLTLEAMKMQTTIYAPCDGVVEQIFVQVGETVESKDLLMRLRQA